MTRAEPNKVKLSELTIRKLQPRERPFLVWDLHTRGLALVVQPTGHKSWKAIYSRQGRARWYSIGSANAIGLAAARKRAAGIMAQVAEGKDPAAERKAERGQGTFGELAERYVNEYAKRKNKSWRQAQRLVQRHLLPRWAKLQAHTIRRADVRKVLASLRPVLANQVLASASAVFSWAIREEILEMVNPCQRVERNRTHSRERVLAESEVPLFWKAFDDAGLIKSSALKMILLTGQRPGEVRHMRREHIVDNWWQLPGAPVPAIGWKGTKNHKDHRIWLPAPARALLAELDDETATGFVFANARGGPLKPLDDAMRAVCEKLGIANPVRPHDLRRSHGSTVTALGFGRPAMDRIQNHLSDDIASVYDRHAYTEENKQIMEAVAARIVSLALPPEDDAGADSNVVAVQFGASGSTSLQG